jgi:acyl-CoA synthetase (AMP-forming)/AMP-acid ligase II
LKAALAQKEQQWDPMKLKSFLKTHLASFKVPKNLIILDELPKGSTGKTLKRELKRQMVDKLEK